MYGCRSLLSGNGPLLIADYSARLVDNLYDVKYQAGTYTLHFSAQAEHFCGIEGVQGVSRGGSGSVLGV